MILTSVHVVAEPEKLALGVCRRCGGHCDFWGAGWSGLTTVRTQHSGGEVRNAVCSRCGGTGKEPAHYVFPGRWYKPWTWFSGYYEDDFGVKQPRPKRYPMERHP